MKNKNKHGSLTLFYCISICFSYKRTIIFQMNTNSSLDERHNIETKANYIPPMHIYITYHFPGDVAVTSIERV